MYTKAKSDQTQAQLLQRELECECRHVKHFDVLAFLKYDHTYFKEGFVVGRENHPEVCFLCDRKFTATKPPQGEDGQWYRVDGNKNMVHACNDAMCEHSKCLKAFCNPCFELTKSAVAGGRRRRQASTVLPGETVGADGAVRGQ